MKLLREYKGITFIYILLTIINVIWVTNYERPNTKSQVNNDKNIVYNID